MSADAAPITAGRFAEAIKDLSLSMLHLKVLELRNSIAHLDYSNEQLRPFAEGTATALDSPSSSPATTQQQQQQQPDQDCVDAIRENEAVVARMQERIALIRAEVESRGLSWTELQSREEVEAERRAVAAAAAAMVNGYPPEDDDTSPSSSSTPAATAGPTTGTGNERQGSHSAWGDGTFQTGTIRNGEVRFDEARGQPGRGGGGGGSLTDEELRRRLEEQMGDLDVDDEGGMHL